MSLIDSQLLKLDQMAPQMVRWAYPANRPSLLPFTVRREVLCIFLVCLVGCHKARMRFKGGIGGVAPDVAAKRRNGIEGGNE